MISASINNHLGLGLQWMLVFITFLFVALRLYVRLRIQKYFGLQDGLLVFAFAVFILSVSVNCWYESIDAYNNKNIYNTLDGNSGIGGGITDPEVFVRYLKTMYAMVTTFYGVVYAVKFCFLFFYFQIIPPSMGKLLVATRFIFWFTLASYITTNGINLLWCIPVNRNWSLDPKYRCFSNPSLIPYLTSTSLHLLTDVLIYAIPFFLLPTLNRNITTRKTIHLACIFALGFLTISVTIVRVALAGYNIKITLLLLLNAAEHATSIIVATLPPIRLLFRTSPERRGSSQSWWQRKKSRTHTESGVVEMEEGFVGRFRGVFSAASSGKDKDSKASISQGSVLSQVDSRDPKTRAPPVPLKALQTLGERG